MAGTHSWERPRADAPRPHVDGHDVFFGECSDSDVEDEDPQPPGAMLVELLMADVLASRLTSKQAAIRLYYAYQAGIKEAKNDQLHPNSYSSNYARKVNDAMGITKHSQSLYEFTVPGTDKLTLGRTRLTAHALPAHEQVSADLRDDAVGRFKLSDLIKRNALPPAYTQRPVVLRAFPALVAFLGIFYRCAAIFSARWSHRDMGYELHHGGAVVVRNHPQEVDLLLRMPRVVYFLHPLRGPDFVHKGPDRGEISSPPP